MKVSKYIYKHIATLGPVGYIPRAPGTFGTLAALLFLLLVKPSGVAFAVLLILISVVGIVASEEAERILREKDSSHIVIDEVAGYFFSMAFLPQTTGYFAAAFVLFRFFDILKPRPLGRLQHISGGAGVMADDIAAGILSNIILQIWRILT